MKKKSIICFAFLLVSAGAVFMVTVSPVISANQQAEETETAEDMHGYIRLFSDAFSVIRENYVEKVPVKEIIYGAISGMVDVLDDYSQFMKPETADRIREDSEGEFGGLGIRIAKEGEFIKVVTPMPDTPAYRQGILPGDLIVKIEDESARGISLEEAVNKLRGPEGTEVTISIEREGEEEYLEFTIERDTIVPRKVFSWMAHEDIAYIRITDFSGNAPEMFKERIEEKLAGGSNALIVDIRNNPGGLLNAAIEVADVFIELGDLIVYTEGRAPNQSREFHSGSESIVGKVPVIVLINRGSASGSEIVAGSLQDHNKAILLGETTFGKASVQSIIGLEDGSSLRLTTAEYYTPSGRPIHEKGVSPDIEIKITTEEMKRISEEKREIYALPEEERIEAEAEISDPQLKRAVDILRARRIFMRDHEN